MKNFFCVLLFVLLVTYNSYSQNWNNIKILKSSCNDVESILGGTPCDTNFISYTLPNEYISFVFASNTEDKKCPEFNYDVSPGTVTQISVIVRYPKKLFVSDLGFDISKFNRNIVPDHLNTYEYISQELGIKFIASNKNQVFNIKYSPEKKYQNTCK